MLLKLKTKIMRQLNLFKKPSLPSLGILTQVIELTSYDMIYIYHHIKKGDELTLQRDHNHIYDKNAIAVFYKGFKLGYVSPKVNQLIASKMNNQAVKAKVKSIQKQKYMPLTGLDIEVIVE